MTSQDSERTGILRRPLFQVLSLMGLLWTVGVTHAVEPISPAVSCASLTSFTMAHVQIISATHNEAAGGLPAVWGGDLDSTGMRFRRMRAEDHHPRKSDGNQHNCEHAARSRSLNPCERPLRSACGPELDVI